MTAAEQTITPNGSRLKHARRQHLVNGLKRRKGATYVPSPTRQRVDDRKILDLNRPNRSQILPRLRRRCLQVGLEPQDRGSHAVCLRSHMFHDVAGHAELTDTIIACAIRVHEVFGPGLLESVYQRCLVVELADASLSVDTHRRVPLVYRGRTLDAVFCPDMVVNDVVIVELKTVELLTAVHTAQVLTYLKLTGLPVGLLLNFNVALLNRGIRRIVRPDLYRPGDK